MIKESKRRGAALFFLVVLTVQTMTPAVSYALTSGPAQPEMQKFSPAGVSDMVDLFSGDFKYNIPLMDVGGYPLNISYASGSGMEDEASWVGAGWSLNPGSVNRALRGLPDDFDGSQDKLIDHVTKEHSMKEFKKVGGELVIKPSLFAWEKGSAQFKVTVYKDNYFGMGASVGAGVDFNLAKGSKSTLTAGLGLDISSDVRDGVNVDPNFSIQNEFLNKLDEPMGKIGLSGGLSYNTRGGLKSVTLGASFCTDVNKEAVDHLSPLRMFGQTYSPSIQTNSSSSGYTFSLDLGPSFFAGYVGLGGKGFYYKTSNTTPIVSAPAFGYLNYLKGRNLDMALLDFNREKDGAFIPGAPSIAIPVSTHDLFTATSQAGSEQFRPMFSGNYVVSDNVVTTSSSNGSIGFTIGAGNVFKGGGRVSKTSGSGESGKWTSNNDFFTAGNAEFTGTDLQEPVAFKMAGEKTRIGEPGNNENFYNRIGGLAAKKVALAGNTALATLKGRDNVPASVSGPIKKINRERRTHAFSYLTAAQASKYGLDKSMGGQSRLGMGRAAHHMSEVTVTGDDGQRKVYGIPVYNHLHQEVSFSVDADASDTSNGLRNGLVGYTGSEASRGNTSGRYNYFTKETTPPYASSFLLTGILSPDYVDVTGNGISDDDQGTAIKFNYTKHTDNYLWRSPYQSNKANYNEGFLSDKLDDRASFVHGKKEIWYVESIESKTMVAVFYTSTRQDGLGVSGIDGGQNATLKLKQLDSIRLFSRADRLKKGNAAIPVKTVHFRYDYSLYPDMPNNSRAVVPDDVNKPVPVNLNAAAGKLTLRKIYFTFGNNKRGETNPYEFSYDMRIVNDGSQGITPPDNTNSHWARERQDLYNERQSDRWGNYKQSWYNHTQSPDLSGKKLLNNSEYPYALQKNAVPGSMSPSGWADLIDRMACKWQLNQIVTPSGSTISVTYESDDYAFVQDRRAMQMCFLKGLAGASNNAITDGFIHSDKITIALPVAVNGLADFKNKYLLQADGKLLDKLFYKVKLDIDNRDHYEYVSGYAEINLNDIVVNDKIATIGLVPVDGANPIARSAWQMLRSSLPQMAYDNYDNLNVGSDAAAAIRSIISAIGNLRELTLPFDEKAKSKNFANKIDLSSSMVRLQQPDYKKTGGGIRVQKLFITDDWATMGGGKTARYGQRYEYKTVRNGVGISSGVASYEPQLGNEENPFHEPVSFTEKVRWGSDKYHFTEKPYCESYFPSASVGYSQVNVIAFGEDYIASGDETKYTGYETNEFYTAKDFPTLVEALTLDVNHYERSTILKLFSSTYINQVAASQGFSVELNDMHGKPKKMAVYNKGGDLVSSTEYFYNVKKEDAVTKELKNEVDVLENNGTITPNVLIGTDVDFITDLRQNANQTVGTNIGAYSGGMIIPLAFIVLYIPYVGINADASVSKEGFRSVSTVKVVQKYGILRKTRTTHNGSSVDSENLLWDGETGAVVLSRTRNEFDKYIYSFNYPAHMAYEGMAGAYKNQGATVELNSVGSNGDIDELASYLFPGDELVSLTGDARVWVIRSPDNTLRIIDKNGAFKDAQGMYLILRSGRRNIVSSSVGSVLSLSDPRNGNSLQLTVDKKILDSKAMLFKEEWALPVAVGCATCPPGYQLSEGGLNCYKETPAQYIPPDLPVCAVGAYGQYSACGTYIYSNYNTSVSSFQRSRIPASNQFWIGWPAAQASYCGNAPALVASGMEQARTKMIDTTELPVKKGSALTALNLVEDANPPVAGPLYRCGIWTCPTGNSNPIQTWIGFSRTINVPETKTYYVGLAADNQFRFKVDGQLRVEYSTCSSLDAFSIWHVFPVELSAGQHIVEMEAYNCSAVAGMGAEIYNNTASEIEQSHSYSDLNVLFSTREMRGGFFQNGVYVCAAGYALNTATTPFTCREYTPAIPQTSSNPFEKVNPYYTGLLGNWRPWISYVYTVNRGQDMVATDLPGATDIRSAGWYLEYSPFWNFSAGLVHTIPVDDVAYQPADKRWLWHSRSVSYDRKGNEVENVDALNKYNAALFGYLGSVSTAVGANSRHNEVAFDGFEDYYFQLGSMDTCNNTRHLNFRLKKSGDGVYAPGGGSLVSTTAHSGKYSYRLSSSIIVTASAGTVAPPASFLGFDGIGRYKLLSNEQAGGFAPVPDKKYLLSLWVNDHATIPINKVQNLGVSINGTAIDLNAVVVPVVEGWKRLDIPFQAGNGFSLELSPNSPIEIDDIRILPFDGQLQSFVYDDVSMRLKAKLDENNFATFYEYDDEGTLIRVKKETERGIMTIRETRQYMRGRP